MPSGIYRRGDVWWGRKQVAGAEHRRSLRTRDRVEALRRYKRWSDELSAAVHFGENRLTWQAAVLRYVAEVMPQAVKPGTAKRYLVSLRQLDPHLSGLYLDQIGRRTVADLLSARRGASNATKRRDLTAASQVMAAAIQWGAAETNPFRDFDRRVVRERREPIRPPTDEEVAAVIRRAPGMLASMIRFLAETGCRQEEAAGLERGQIDHRRGEVMLLKTKTSRPRRIRVAPETLKMLGSLPVTLASPYVFWHGAGERYANVASRFRALVRDVERSAQKAGTEFQPFRCHDLRHRYAIDELRNGRDIYDLSRHLGHSSVKTTEIYLGYVGIESAQKPAQRRRFAAEADDA